MLKDLKKNNPLFFPFLISAAGIIIYLIAANTFQFKEGSIFSLLYKKPKSLAISTSDTSYHIKVLVIKYFPLTADGLNIDISVTGDVGEPYSVIRQRTVDVTNVLKASLEKATKYLGYKNPTAPSSLTYQIIDTIEHIEAVPTKDIVIPGLGPWFRYANYGNIMATHGICNYVDNLGVSEVWLWAYQGPPKADGSPYLNIFESKMSGPHGDISNSARLNDMTLCTKTYKVYTLNYSRYTAEALESWGHQLEAEMDAVNRFEFRELWQGPKHPQTLGVNGRCGSTHNPPNARSEYDRNNTIPQKSDCLDWNPDSIGVLSDISCLNWGCGEVDPVANNAHLNYQIWNWQNLPGRNNTRIYGGARFRNLWDIHGDFDNVRSSRGTFFLDIVPPPPGAPNLTSFSGFCSGGTYVADISWSGSPLPPEDLDCGNGFWVDVSTDPGFGTYSHKCVTGTSTPSPSGFGPAFTYNAGTTYYARVFNDSPSGHSGTLFLSASSCVGPPPPPPPPGPPPPGPPPPVGPGAGGLGKIVAPDILKPFIIAGGSGTGGFNLFISNLIKVIFAIAGVVLVFMFVIGSWEYLTSGGNKEKLAQSRSRIIYAIIGLMLFAVAFAVISVLSTFTGFRVF